MKITTTLRFIVFWLCMLPLFCIAQDRQNDSLALATLHNATNGTYWIYTWDLTQPMDTWYGVTLNEYGRVTKLYIPENELNGVIPPELGNLDQLEELHLQYNNLSSNLPDEIGNLTNLKLFNVTGNALSDLIPTSFVNLNKLTVLSFSENQFEGNVLDIIINFRYLEFLYVSHNQFTGSIPQYIGGLNQLKEMSLYDNQFSGYLPPELADLQQLTLIKLGLNQFEGCYPNNISNFCSFPQWADNDHMSDGNNFIAAWEDFCSTEAGSCSPCRESDSLTLVALHESTNGANWTNPWNLDLPMDTWYGISLNSNGCVTCIDMDDGSSNCGADYTGGGNNLQGNIPAEIGNLGSLEVLNLMNNQLISNIPSEIGNLGKLTTSLFGGNQLSGNIPKTIGNLDNLQTIDWSSNKLNGRIPSEIGDLDSLSTLNLWGNELSGSIPREIGNLNNLEQLKLFDNQLIGIIPSEIMNLTNLRWVYLHDNQLSGSIFAFENLDALEDLRLSGNQFSGNIPNFSNLKTLHLHKNKFSHEDIAANFNSNNTINYITYNNFTYSPQYYGSWQFHTNTTGATVVLSPVPSIPYANPMVKWLQDDEYKTPEYILHDTTYTITSLDTVDIGRYQYRFVDSTLTPMVEFHSNPVNSYIEGLDLSGNPIIAGQFIIDYGSDVLDIEIEFIRAKLANEYRGTLINSRGYNVLIDLWRFEDSRTIDTLKTIFVDTRYEHSKGEPDIDGSHDIQLSSETTAESECSRFTPDYDNGEQIIIYPYNAMDTSSEQIVIAVIDSGTPQSFSHIFENKPEKHGYVNVDDDNNNYIDDVYGVDFVGDLSGFHGEAVISTIIDNIPDNMNIQVMPIKTFDAEGKGTLFDLVCGIYYAVDNGADIINISAGYTGNESVVLKNALKFGRDNNVIFVVSAGNDAKNLNTNDYWPASFARDTSLMSTVITTAAVNDDYAITDYSNRGDSTVTIAVPGSVRTAIGCLLGTSVSAPLVALGVAMEKSLDADRNHTVIRQDFLQKMDTSTDLEAHIRDGRVLRVGIKRNNCEQIQNGDFSDGQTGWRYFGCNVTNIDNGLAIEIPAAGQNSWDVKLAQQRFFYEQGKQYSVSFKAKADANRKIGVKPGLRGEPYTDYGSRKIYLTTTLQTHEFVFTMNEPTDLNGYLEFHLGESDVNLFITDISVSELSCAEDFPTNCEQVKNGDFSNGHTDWGYWGCDITNMDDGLAIDVPSTAENFWDIALAQQGFLWEQGKQYQVSFKAKADANRSMRVKAGFWGIPYTTYHFEDINLTTTLQSYEFSFAMNEPTDLNGFLEFHLGESDINLFITDISLIETSCIESREGLFNEMISNYLVFPNPTSGTLNISFDLPANDDSGTIRLFDLNGKLLLEHRESMFTTNQFQLDVNNIPAGVYLLRINVGEYMLTHKVIKSHR